MVEAESIDIRPQFQRRERWDIARQSALIESFLLNIPVPPVYLAEDDFGKYSVIDGKQRITAIANYMRNGYQLNFIDRFPEVQGAYFSDLPKRLQNALTVRPYIRAITILRQSGRQTKYEVFHRLNSGGQPLNAQEIRNVIYRGLLNDALIELSKNSFLRKQLKIKDDRSPAYQAMTDVEFVLRYLTLTEEWQNFSSDYRKSMDNFMERHEDASSREVAEYKLSFQRSIGYCESIWGEFAFKRPDKNSWRDQALAGMYDAQMVAIGLLTDKQAEAAVRRRTSVIDGTRDLFNDDEFETAVRVATNTPSRVRLRVERMYDLLRTVGR
ncbi:DUF262 domain-containing protein [Saccharothrix sp. 6-C]|nr:DUF262 domain-containing protein [Saccharothrix sp. 6-C]